MGKSQLTWRTAFTAVTAVLVVAAVAAFILKTPVSLTLTIIAAMIAVALDHAVQFLVRKGMSHRLAVAAVVFGSVGGLVAFSFLVIPPTLSQGQVFLHQAPSIWSSFQKTRLFEVFINWPRGKEALEAASSEVIRWIERSAPHVLTVVGGAVSGFVTVLVLVVFMLAFAESFISTLLNELFVGNAERYRRILGKIYRSVGGYLGGLAVICGINSTLTTLWLAIIGTPFFLPLGIMSGVSSMVPYLGPLVMGVTVTAVVLTSQGPWKGLATAIYFIVYGQLEGNLLSPFVFRKTLHINPLLSLLSILFLAEIGGVFGVFLAVPVVASVQIIVREVLSNHREASGQVD
jgi:predicted PurR-regulated permease PerM